MPDGSEILLTLFNTLTKAFERTEKANENLVKQQGELVHHIKSLKLDEIKQSLKDHGAKSTSEIGTCTEEVKSVDSKVSKMITVVITVTSIFSISLLIASVIVYYGNKKAASPKMDPAVIEQIIHKAIEKHEEQETEKFEEIKKELEKLHNNGKTAQ